MRTVETALEDQGFEVILRSNIEEVTFSEGSPEVCKQEGCTNPALKKRTETIHAVLIDGREYEPADLVELAPLILSDETAHKILTTRRELVICLACLTKELAASKR